MKTPQVSRAVKIPDPIRITRYQRSPEIGPTMLFFSGGSAINDLSQKLKYYTHNSIHMVTPFDSGGSSAVLRKAFNMPSIGDLRSRLMALADETITGQPDVYQLFTHRFPLDAKNSELAAQLKNIRDSKDPLIRAITNPMRRLIRNQLGYICEALPKSLDLRGASIGNLILAGGYLNNHQHLDPIIFLFSKLVNVLGTVRATVSDNLHIGADLVDGTQIIGQHLLTGKQTAPITSPVKKLFLSASSNEFKPAKAEIRKKNRRLITSAELICFPPGSFYSSLIANLLPKGVGSAIAANDCPKIYIPNLGNDPEQFGVSMDQSLKVLLNYLRADVSSDCPTQKLLNFVLVDTKNGQYPDQLSTSLLRKLDIQLIDTKLVSKQSAPYYDPELLVAALLSLT